MPRRAFVASALALLLLAPLLLAAPGSRAAAPALPAEDGGALLSNLSAPALTPTGRGAVGFELSDPLGGPLSAVTLSFQVYAFIPFPGNASASPPSGASPTLSSPNASGLSVSISLARLGPGASFRSPGNVSLSIAAPANASSGTYAIRTSLWFTEGGVGYRFESRGFFSNAEWENATTGPNGRSTLNLSRLGVSGVLPETAVLVQNPSIDPVLDALLGASALLAGVGGYVAWRKGPGSRSGARSPDRPNHAPSALGKSRTSDGD